MRFGDVPVNAGTVELVNPKAIAKAAVIIAKGGKAAVSAVKALFKGDPPPRPRAGSSGGPGEGRPFSQKTKDQAGTRDRETCVFCGAKTTRAPGPTQRHTDHAIPKVRGGNNTLPNAQTTCRTCNLRKGRRTSAEFQDLR